MKTFLIILLCAAAAALSAWITWGNKALQLSEFTVVSDRIPHAFAGFRIAQISDLHNARFGEDNAQLIDLLVQADPDIIVLTGDLVDSRRTDIQLALDFAAMAVEIAPVYYVTGNHESRIDDYPLLTEGLAALGVIVLEDDCAEITVDGESVALLGVNDPSFVCDYLTGDSAAAMRDALDAFTLDEAVYTILLSHRPELFEVYTQYGIDLIFSGHAHGGQFRLPVIGGLIAPGQGLFPEYDSGLYSAGKSNMIVSRGIGNSAFPFRVNNRPEIVVAILSPAISE